MKSVHGSPDIDFREVLISHSRSGSSLSYAPLLPLSNLFFALLSKHPHACTLLIMCYRVMPWAGYWVLAAAVGKSWRANYLPQYLKSLKMINAVLRGAISRQTAHHKHISPGNYRAAFPHTFISAILNRGFQKATCAKSTTSLNEWYVREKGWAGQNPETISCLKDKFIIRTGCFWWKPLVNIHWPDQKA